MAKDRSSMCVQSRICRSEISPRRLFASKVSTCGGVMRTAFMGQIWFRFTILKCGLWIIRFPSALATLGTLRLRAERLGSAEPGHFVFSCLRKRQD